LEHIDEGLGILLVSSFILVESVDEEAKAMVLV
jgi:hypothetical protein